MAQRTFWKGYLKLSLVTCAVTLMPATSESERIRFHTLNRKTGNRVQSRYVDAVSNKPVDDDDQVKGYQKSDDDYVMLEDDEIDAVALETTHTIDIETFVKMEAIPWVFYDKPHYLAPDDEMGAEAFAVIREAMKASKVMGIARLVLYRRERAVMIEARDNGIILWTLRYGDEVRDEDEAFGNVGAAAPDAQMKTLIGKLITSRTKDWSSELVTDPVQDRLQAIIAEKSKGKKKAQKSAAKPEPTGDNVISIMDALRNSLKAKR